MIQQRAGTPSPLEIYRRQRAMMTHRIRSLPILVLMPHSRCNGRCVMCDIWKARSGVSELSHSDLIRHADAFRRLEVRWVVLSGGEALMHSNLWALCELLKEGGVRRITLLSTGLLLKRCAAETIRWCDEAIVSLDGGPDIHDAIRNVDGAYDRLADGVAALKKLNPSFRVTARCVVQRRNCLQMAEIVDAAHALGLDQISFLPVDASSTAFSRATPLDRERTARVALSGSEIRAFEETLERITARYAEELRSGFIAESPEKLRRMTRYFAALNGDGDFPPITCNAPWVSAVVEPDGTLRPCFFQPPLGNIHERALDEIVNSVEATMFRRTLDVQRNAICRRCVCTLYLAPWASV